MSDGPIQLRRAVPGKKPLTAGLTAQPRASAEPEGEAAGPRRMHVGAGYGSPVPPLDELKPVEASEIAASGVAGPHQALPHADAIQRSFGSHDVTSTRAHVGGAAADAAAELGAEAFATGSDVAFRQAPDLHTAAHEAAHIVQQRLGVQLKGGMGEAGDVYERHADAVADLVVQGRSAEALLSQHPQGSTGAAEPAVQRQAAGDSSGSPRSPESPEQAPGQPRLGDNVLLEAFDLGGAAGDLLASRVAAGLQRSPRNYVEVIYHRRDPAQQAGSTYNGDDSLAQMVPYGLQKSSGFPGERFRFQTRPEPADAPAGSFRQIEVWLRTGEEARDVKLPLMEGSRVPPPPSPPPGEGPGPTPAQLAAPPEAIKRVRDLGDLLEAAGDAAAQDKVVRALRDAVVSIEPFFPDAAVKDMLNNAIASGVPAAIKAAIQKALEAVAGTSASTMPQAASHTGPPPIVGSPNLKETILKFPELPLPFDRPPPKTR